ncbi:MAG: MATE family efflux transporter [Huintestinicola sp.]|uniref:MATE family efflux transporter n=1 Tax=Huintestinicola sp. TaxID=2981661 RepID=UPI003F093F78
MYLRLVFLKRSQAVEIFALVFIKAILRIMQTDSSILNDTLIYGRIIFGGLAVTVSYDLCSGILRALGDSKTPFKAIIISSTINILLDILFIFVLKTGVAGAAAATVTSQLVSVVICIQKIRKTEIMKFGTKDYSKDFKICLQLLKNGLPMAFMNSLTAVGCIIMQSYINKLGVDYTSAYSVCSKYLNLFMLPSITAGLTISAFTGQNFGAKKFDRIKAGVVLGLVIAFLSYIILGLIMHIFPSQLASLMLSGENAVKFTSEYIGVLGFTLIGVNCNFIFRNAVQGMGCPTVPMISGILEMVFRLAAVYVLIPKFGFIATAYADAAAWAGALFLNMTAYFVLIRKKCGSE